LRIVIDGRLPSLNEYIAAERTYRYIAAKMKKDATELVAWQCKQIKPITEPADYTFTWYVANNRTDPDNIAFACKFVFDGLQSAGKLPNDSMKYIKSITHHFMIGEPKVEIQIDEA